MDAAPSYRSAVAFGSLLPLLAACVGLHGAQLPLHRYTTADGLASNTINDIVSDSRGFLWCRTGALRWCSWTIAACIGSVHTTGWSGFTRSARRRARTGWSCSGPTAHAIPP